jgi:hypothetical protein
VNDLCNHVDKKLNDIDGMIIYTSHDYDSSVKTNKSYISSITKNNVQLIESYCEINKWNHVKDDSTKYLLGLKECLIALKNIKWNKEISIIPLKLNGYPAKINFVNDIIPLCNELNICIYLDEFILESCTLTSINDSILNNEWKNKLKEIRCYDFLSNSTI